MFMTVIVMTAKCYSMCKVNKKIRNLNMYGVIFFQRVARKKLIKDCVKVYMINDVATNEI